jgi:sterol desaturase/sphingolipid hydroxylase (fatty acid hydroxylase superfamily)
MKEFVISNYRILIALVVLSLLLLIETFFPFRKISFQERIRHIGLNFSFPIFGAILLRVFSLTGLYAWAFYVQNFEWGLLSLTGLPQSIQVILAILAFDFAIYLQHVLSHHLPLFWKFHQMHHSDHFLDTSSGIRFHPVEILISHFYKIGWILVLGGPAVSILIFEVLLNVSSLFNHSNFALPKQVEKILRGIIVTPTYHRIHHSVVNRETDSNFGFNLSIWDRIFGTYTASPKSGDENVEIGLSYIPKSSVNNLASLLKLPFTLQLRK